MFRLNDGLFKFLEDNYRIFNILRCIEMCSVSNNRIFCVENKEKKYIVRLIIKDDFDKDKLMFACSFENKLNIDIQIAPHIYMSKNDTYVEMYMDNYIIVMEYVPNESVNICTIGMVLSALSILLIFVNYSIKNGDYLKKIENNAFKKYAISNKVLYNLRIILEENEKRFEFRASKLSAFAQKFYIFCDNVIAGLLSECCVVHGDIHRDNFLFSAGKAHHIIDFDTANLDLPYVDLGSFIVWACFQDANSKYHKIDQGMYLMILKRIKRICNIKIQIDYLSFYVVAILMKHYRTMDDEMRNIITDYLEKNYKESFGHL